MVTTTEAEEPDVQMENNDEPPNLPAESSNSSSQIALKYQLLNHLCNQSNVFFRSQQIEDADITVEEKLKISNEILDKSHSIFLSRFGNFLEMCHLKFFENQEYSSEEQYMVNFYLKEIKSEHKNKDKNVKNRRYAHLLKLIEEKKYFSIAEMKEREPLLYEHLVGQYKSATEKRLEERPDANTDTLIDILYQGIDRDHRMELEAQQREVESKMSTGDTESCGRNSDTTDVEVSSDDEQHSPSKKWGDFDDPVAGSSKSIPKESKKVKRLKRKERKQSHLITAAERDLLKDEFLGIMYSNFLMGKDKDVDYNSIDNNTNLDITAEKEQDLEDSYFENYDSDDVQNDMSEIKIESSQEESKDELDLYMKHLEDHLKKQQQSNSIEEFDDV